MYRIQDMEDTILSLRRLLNEREREIDELKTLQQDLESQLNQQRSSSSSDEIYKVISTGPWVTPEALHTSSKASLHCI